MAWTKRRFLAALGEWHYGRWLRFHHFRRLVRRLPLQIERAVILDAGCGSGQIAFWLAKTYPTARIVGVDRDRAGIERCSRRALEEGLTNLRFETAALDTWSWAGTFDLVYSIHVLEYIADDEDVLVRLHDSLRPDGILVVEVREQGLGTDTHFGLRRLMPKKIETENYMRGGYSVAALTRLVRSHGFDVLGHRHTLAPPALFAHTVFEALRDRHLRWYLLLLPVLKLVGLSDFLWPWRRGGSLTVWARRLDA